MSTRPEQRLLYDTEELEKTVESAYESAFSKAQAVKQAGTFGASSG